MAEKRDVPISNFVRPSARRTKHSRAGARFPDIELDRSQAKVIRTPSDITPEWIARVLNRNSADGGVRVRRVDVILAKKLAVSTVYRLGLTYEDETVGSNPASLFLKIPHVLSQDTGGIPNDGRPEVEFYRDVAPLVGSPPLVCCYDAAYSEETRHSHLLLEDLSETHMQPEQQHAPSEELSRLAVATLAKAHAACWGSSSNELIRKKKFGDAALRSLIVDLQTNVTGFLIAEDLTAEQERAYRWMLKNAGEIWGRIARDTHLTVTHGDTHWWNFLYPKNMRTDSIRIFDWHLWHIDLGARDLAFLLALGGFAEPRPDLEDELLRIYHDTLGVSDYTWEMLVEDYRWSAIRNLNIPVIFRAQGKHESTWRTALRRAWEAYERLGCESLIAKR